MLRWMFPMLLTLMAPVAARAEGYSADNLLPHCKPPDQFCTGYLLAVVDAENEKAVGKQFCLPKGLDVDVVNSAFQRYAVAHPEALAHSAARVAGLSVRERFPCK